MPDEQEKDDAARTSQARRHALVLLNELKGEFLGRVSHELRAPLTLVRGYAELLRDREFPPDQVKELATELVHEAEHLARLVDALLDVGALQRAGRSTRPAAVPARLAVKEAWALQAEADRLDRRLDLDVPDDQTVWADPDDVGEILRALLDNALKYSPAGTAIAVSAGPRDDGVAVTVSDLGIGFDLEAAERLFEPLYRIEGDAAHQVRGLGLGLATAHALVAAQGGTITAHSDGPGRGARFEVWFPARPD